jgi:hypothetical protein
MVKVNDEKLEANDDRLHSSFTVPADSHFEDVLEYQVSSGPS